MDVMDPTMLAQSDHALPAHGVGKFFKLFFVFFLTSSVAGEMSYDGDFTKPRTVPSAIMRSCVETFRAEPLKMTMNADATPPIAAAMQDKSASSAIKQLRSEGFNVADATLLYVSRLQHNDRVLYAEKSASHVIPEFIRHDTCRVEVFLKGDRVTGAFARAVRELSPAFRNLPAPPTLAS